MSRRSRVKWHASSTKCSRSSSLVKWHTRSSSRLCGLCCLLRCCLLGCSCLLCFLSCVRRCRLLLLNRHAGGSGGGGGSLSRLLHCSRLLIGKFCVHFGL